MIFDRGRTAKKRKDVLFIDASREFAQEKRQNRLRDEDLAKIVKTYGAFKSIDKYAYRATFKEIAENEFNLGRGKGDAEKGGRGKGVRNLYSIAVDTFRNANE